MKKTNILKCLSALLLITGGLTLASCGEESNVTSKQVLKLMMVIKLKVLLLLKKLLQQKLVKVLI